MVEGMQRRRGGTRASARDQVRVHGRRRPPATLVAVALTALSVVATACQFGVAPGKPTGTDNPAGPTAGGSTTGGGGSTSGPAPSPSPSPEPVSAAQISITPERGNHEAAPEDGLAVTVTDGTLTKVTARTDDGDEVPGAFNEDQTEWHSTWALTTSTKYLVWAKAVDADGLRAGSQATFTTLSPDNTFSAQIYEGFHKEYGVGMPVILRFSDAIENKAEVEQALELRTSKPVVGAWYWSGDSTLYFRPRTYWPAHTDISFIGHLDGVAGGDGMYGVHTLTQDWSIGRSLIAVAGTRTHEMDVYLDKKKIGTWPISTGKPGDETANGTYLSITKANPEEMIGEDYDILVPFSVRITYSGAFVHAAPWSLNQQGSENVSHGCVNLAPQYAEKYYNLSVPGDPVTITGSPVGGKWDNGWTVWFLGWKDLVDGSAMDMAVKANADGSTFVSQWSLPPSNAKSPLGVPKPGNALASS
jgi:lipoprotein-anchoring transpeptidase ErfK/SrfK